MPIDSRIIVPSVLGVSLVALSAFVYYYITRKDEEDEQAGRQIKSSRGAVIEVSVPKHSVPALIGRGGSNIKDIQNRSNTSISFKRRDGNESDILIIRGRAECAQLAETIIHEFIKNQPTIEEIVFMVPQWACGKIIGTNGDNIHDISHRSGARVKIESVQGSGDGSTERACRIRGTKQQIQTARELVEKYVAMEKCRREINTSKRTPRIQTDDVSHNGDDDPEARPTVPRQTSPSSGVSGASLDVYVSAVASPSRFWIQLVGPQVAQLDALVQQMSDYYENEKNRAMHKLEDVTVGSIVACVFRADGRWYRGRVTELQVDEITGNTVADVFFVDYGDSEYVGLNELYELTANFLKLKFQALECFLAGVAPAKKSESVKLYDNWDTKAIDRFEYLAQVARWKTLVSKTVMYKDTGAKSSEGRSNPIPGVRLFDVTEDGELDIGDVLIAEGWAEPVNNNHLGQGS